MTLCMPVVLDDRRIALISRYVLMLGTRTARLQYTIYRTTYLGTPTEASTAHLLARLSLSRHRFTVIQLPLQEGTG